MKRSFACLIFTAAATFPVTAQFWNSRLLPNINGTYSAQTVNFAARSWTLDDFSYVGYFLGAKSLGSVPCNVVNVTGTGDITQAVQAAVDQVGNAGGGIVRLPAGTFTISASVAVPYNNVSIEGAGSGQTIINVPSNYASENGATDGLFTFGRALGAATNNGWVAKGPVIANVTAAIHRGDLQMMVDNASKINAGDWIVVQQYFSETLVTNNSGAVDQWAINSCCEFSFTYLRQVTAKTGNQISLDAPIPWTLDPANNNVHVRTTDGQMKENSGVKGMTIQFANNTLASTGRPHGTAVYFEGVRNGWAYDVEVRNFPRFGIYANYSARVTILDCRVQTAQDKGGEGYGYGYLVSPSQNILIKRSRGEDTRHNFITSHPQTSMVVQTQNTSVNEIDPDDSHFGFEQGILWDMHTQLNGGAIEALNRGDQSGGAYETLASGVIWNFYGDGVKNNLVSLQGALYLKPSADGELIVVGVNGAHGVFDSSQGNVSPFVPGQRMQANAGLQVGSSPGALQNVLYEGLYQTGLQPASLYETQLATRVGTVPADWIDVCGATPVLTPGGIANAASFAGPPVSPGEIVALFGTAMGPPVIVNAQLDVFGLVAKSLAGTRVLFDGIPGPIVFTRSDVVSAVVPYATSGKSTTQVKVEYFGQRSAPMTFPVVPSTPGIFQLGTSSGGAAICAFNADGSLNSPSNPAPAGSEVFFYATGGGQTNPPGVDGSPAAAPYPVPQLPLSVTIGGTTATLQFAAAAPGAIAGLLQINAVVPTGLPSSDIAALTLIIGGTPSQSACTVAVH